jgi:hypothetical protein
MLRALMLSLLAPALVCGSASVLADALASASVNITRFTWYADNGDGVPGAGDVPLTVAVPGGPALSNENLRLIRADDKSEAFMGVTTSTNIDAGGGGAASGDRQNRLGGPTGADLNDPLDVPRVCVGGDCNNPAIAPQENDFSPLGPGVAGQFANADQLLNGFFLAVTDGPSSGIASGGVRADASLPTLDLEETYTAKNSARIFNNQRQDNYTAANDPFPALPNGDFFDTYFEIEFAAEAIAQLSPTDQSESIAEADVTFDILVLGRNGSSVVVYSWVPDDPTTGLNIGATASNPGDLERVQRSGTINSYDDIGMLQLFVGHSYNVSWQMEALVDAQTNIPPAGVPVPPTVLLFLTGLFGLNAARHALRLPPRSSAVCA